MVIVWNFKCCLYLYGHNNLHSCAFVFSIDSLDVSRIRNHLNTDKPTHCLALFFRSLTLTLSCRFVLIHVCTIYVPFIPSSSGVWLPSTMIFHALTLSIYIISFQDAWWWGSGCSCLLHCYICKLKFYLICNS